LSYHRRRWLRPRHCWPPRAGSPGGPDRRPRRPSPSDAPGHNGCSGRALWGARQRGSRSIHHALHGQGNWGLFSARFRTCRVSTAALSGRWWDGSVIYGCLWGPKAWRM